MQQAATETSRAAVANFFRALRAGDMDALRAAFTPDATWILRGGLPASGTWTGPDGIMDGFFPRIFGRLDPGYHAISFTANGARVACEDGMPRFADVVSTS